MNIAHGVIQAAAFAVFQVLFQHLVAADLVLPHLRSDALEVFVGVDVHPPGGCVIAHLLHHIAALSLILDTPLAPHKQGSGAQQVQVNQLLAEGSHLAEERAIGSEGDAREVGAQFLGVLLAVGRAVEDGVDIGQHVFRRGEEAVGGAQFGQQPVGQVGLLLLVEHIRRFGGGVEIEGK